MGTEIERKFLVVSSEWRQTSHKSTQMRQGYLSNNERCSIRVRVNGDNAQLNIKGATLGVSRQEFEYPIPIGEGKELLDGLSQTPLIEKTRHYIKHGQHIWEIDEFEGDNTGLIVAEIELDQEDEYFEKPGWVGEEVSHDARYYNVNLIKCPYKNWIRPKARDKE